MLLKVQILWDQLQNTEHVRYSNGGYWLAVKTPNGPKNAEWYLGFKWSACNQMGGDQIPNVFCIQMAERLQI